MGLLALVVISALAILGPGTLIAVLIGAAPALYVLLVVGLLIAIVVLYKTQPH
jgi:hypothetical protein